MPITKSGAFDIDFEWFPDPIVVAEATDAAVIELSDLRPPLEQSLVTITRDVRQRFDLEGPGWAPWAVGPPNPTEGPAGPYTRTYKGGVGILNRDDAGLQPHATSPESYLVTNNSIIYQPYQEPIDIVHQEGSNVRNIYARPFIGLSPVGEEGVMETFEAWLGRVAGQITGDAGLGAGEKLVVAAGATRVSVRGKGGRFVA